MIKNGEGWFNRSIVMVLFRSNEKVGDANDEQLQTKGMRERA
jgi:hypothetical protein